MAIPLSTTGSLGPAFATARPVGLAVRHTSTLALVARLPSVLSVPSSSSVIFWEETAPVKLTLRNCPAPCFKGSRLDIQTSKGGISLTSRPDLTTWLHRLPLMLHMPARITISDYSKGSWGLSVLLRVAGIFTGITTSPRSTLRQCPDRYTIRAGRNLPDKEFRYLRTVIVTADIHRGFSLELRLAPDPSL
jgi:hypothetical protein